jgi:hypothetical protein
MLFVHKTTYLACANICQPVLVGLDTFARHWPTIFPGFDTFARHSPTISPDSIHLLTFNIRHFWEKCDSPWHIRTSNSPFWWIWGEWPLLSIFACSVQVRLRFCSRFGFAFGFCIFVLSNLVLYFWISQVCTFAEFQIKYRCLPRWLVGTCQLEPMWYLKKNDFSWIEKQIEYIKKVRLQKANRNCSSFIF